MRKVLAIARIAILNSVRSRMVLVLLALLALAIVALPLTIKGDGTAQGQVQILLGYTLGAVSLVLSLATLWAGCAAVSTEIEERQLHLVVTKPVHRAQVWLGKWIGLVTVNALLLAASGSFVYASLRWSLRRQDFPQAGRERLQAEVLTANRLIAATPVDISAEARARLDALKRSGDWMEPLLEAEALRVIGRDLLTRAYAVPAGSSRRWDFTLPRPLAGDRALLLRFRFAAAALETEPVRGRWRVLAGGDPVFERTEDRLPGAPHVLDIPAGPLAGTDALTVEFANANTEPVTVFFDPESGVELLAHERGFEPNFMLALLAILVHLAFLAALGVTAGSLFSMPVASFAAFWFVLLMQLGAYIHSFAEPAFAPAGPAAPPAGAWEPLFRAVFRMLDLVVSPLHGTDPIGLLSGGQAILPAMLLRELLVKLVLYGGLMAVLSSAVLNRREIALPS
jgi:ABC-type transport system involved in multi-copper enzyme maturation permease subunit